MVTDLFWKPFSIFALACLVSFSVLAIGYMQTKRWNLTWKERWERRHAASLEALRSKFQRTLTVMLIMRWVALVLFLVCVGFGLGPIVTAIKGLSQKPAADIIGFAALDLLALVFLAGVAVSVSLLRYRIRRIDELLAAGPRR